VLSVPPGTLLQPVGNLWAAYSPASGETQLLNNEAAAFLEVLREQPRSLEDAADVLAREIGLPVDQILPLLADAAVELTVAGLIRERSPASLD
jgi:PqqD family protein of HPr-rel-A system